MHATVLRSFLRFAITAVVAVVAVAMMAAAQPTLAQRFDDPRLGAIDFPTSGSAAARPYFLRGVLYLHSFEYDSAAKQFREAQRRDSSFAMAYWGEAMTYTHPVWNQQDVAAGRAALARLGSTAPARRSKAPTAREQRYLDAVEVLYGDGAKPRRDTLHSAVMQSLAADFPKDREAMAFYSLSLLGLGQSQRDVATYMRAAAPMEELFAENPRHPGAAHYLIHAYDDPTHAPLGLRAARAYSKIAPGAAHAQHMVSHIFIALGMWDDVVAANEIAWPQANHAGGHYAQWLMYGYVQEGRLALARAVIDSARAHAAASPDRTSRSSAAMLIAQYAINVPDADSAPLRDVGTDLVAGATAAVAFARAHGAFASRNAAAIERSLVRIDSAYASLRAANRPDLAPNLQTIEFIRGMTRSLLLESTGRRDSALATLAALADRYDALPFEFGPPPTLKPPRELLGELLIIAGQPANARRQFELSLATAPGRVASLLGLARASARAGDSDGARRAYAALLAGWRRADPTFAPRNEAQRGAGSGTR